MRLRHAVGFRFETTEHVAVSNMTFGSMAFKSAAHLSHLRAVKTLEQLGASLSNGCTAGREEIDRLQRGGDS